MTEQDLSQDKKPIPIRQRPSIRPRSKDLNKCFDPIDLEKEREKRKPSDFYREGI